MFLTEVRVVLAPPGADGGSKPA
ncbi:MAG: hypothetical protein FD161_4975, partial [Limisphaerales bacterium]